MSKTRDTSHDDEIRRMVAAGLSYADISVATGFTVSWISTMCGGLASAGKYASAGITATASCGTTGIPQNCSGART